MASSSPAALARSLSLQRANARAKSSRSETTELNKTRKHLRLQEQTGQIQSDVETSFSLIKGRPTGVQISNDLVSQSSGSISRCPSIDSSSASTEGAALILLNHRKLPLITPNSASSTVTDDNIDSTSDQLSTFSCSTNSDDSYSCACTSSTCSGAEFASISKLRNPSRFSVYNSLHNQRGATCDCPNCQINHVSCSARAQNRGCNCSANGAATSSGDSSKRSLLLNHPDNAASRSFNESIKKSLLLNSTANDLLLSCNQHLIRGANHCDLSTNNLISESSHISQNGLYSHYKALYQKGLFSNPKNPCQGPKDPTTTTKSKTKVFVTKQGKNTNDGNHTKSCCNVGDNKIEESRTCRKRAHLIPPNSLAEEKISHNPYEDFRASMYDMIMDKGVEETENMEELLHSYLRLNPLELHDLIREVFSEVWTDIIMSCR